MELTPAPLDEDLAAAVLAAVVLYTEAEAAAEEPACRPAWRAAALIAAQGIAPARGVGATSWATAERAGRAARWSTGLLGMFG
ncbi:MAG TPA: hypothetical protein VNL77_02255 [Roseiflexaceae bacterium]|nr:hypothetical protein [Roseiflexaceae bacterium]